MLRLKYIGMATYHPVTSFKTISDNVVEVISTELPFFPYGFEIYNDDHQLIGKYDKYTTQYRSVEGGLQFSNNKSVWIPTVTFNVSGGGTLEGDLVQHSTKWDYIVFPTYVETEHWKWTGWSNPLPTEGYITDDASTTGIFEYVPTELEKRVTTLETEVTELTPYTASQKAYLGDTSVTFTGVTGTNLTVYANTDSGNAVTTTSVLADNTVTVSFDALTEAATITISLI